MSTSRLVFWYVAFVYYQRQDERILDSDYFLNLCKIESNDGVVEFSFSFLGETLKEKIDLHTLMLFHEQAVLKIKANIEK
jgi:hypothetical protein